MHFYNTSSLSFFAEREGFKPPVPFSTAVFKTAAIDHSATFPELSLFRKHGKGTTLFYSRNSFPQ